MNHRLLNPEERRQLAEDAVLLRAKNKKYVEIAQALDIDKNTVGVLLEEEYERRRPKRERERARALYGMDALIAEGWKRLAALPENSTTQNVTGILNAIRAQWEVKNRLTGAEMPTRSEHTITRFDLESMEQTDLKVLADIAQKYPDIFNELLTQ